ncbi:hypothetical protein [Azohydromonas aeria]|uniref:hypothetical protein n=1 Tax=Azohydromonas aeria TaxID=2590212 RepID=UPI0012FBA0B0|nr:hypothetical protein [Azohydromonas aeria]
MSLPISSATASSGVNPGQPPRVLFVQTEPWVGPERLVLALMERGVACAAWHPEGTTLQALNLALRAAYRPGSSWAGLLDALRRFAPQRIVPLDDRAVLLLAQLWQQQHAALLPFGALLRDSLGNMDSLALRGRRSALVALGKQVLQPEGWCPEQGKPLHEWAQARQWRCVLKAEATVAGTGVALVSSRTEFDAALQRLQGAGRPLIAQALVRGRCAMRACLAQGGRVVAGMSLLNTQQQSGTGPATRVRAIASEDMRIACERLAALWCMDGYFSVDFMIDEASGRALAIECNPRPVAWLHLGRLVGVDLIGAFVSSITHPNVAAQLEQAPLDQEIALFPREWVRDPRSPFLSGPAHDVPWAYPALVTRVMQAAVQEMAARRAAAAAAAAAMPAV